MRYVYRVILSLFITSAVLCGCASDEYANKSGEAVNFTAEISGRTETRATVDTTKNTSSGINLIVRVCEPAKGITESVSAMTRTSTVDGSWSAGNIAVEKGSTVKEYSVDASGNITSSSPFYWTSESNVSVTSWYPYSASLSTWTVNSDQSTEAKYAAGDLLYASGTLTYGSSNKLTFSHKTAKVVINIVKANSVTSASNISSVTIGTSGSEIDLSGTVGSTGTIAASTTTTGYIKPYQTTSSTYAATYSALVIPQDMNGKEFIAIEVGSKTYYYKPATSTALSGGYQYTYNITIPSSTTSTPGTYYFSDGTWGTLAANPNKTPIAVVFSSGIEGSAAYTAGYTHGLAIALTDANSGNTGFWASSYNVLQSSYSNISDAVTDVSSGYTGGITNGYGKVSSDYAFYYCTMYGNTVSSTPTNSSKKNSGWYLPSVGEMIAMYKGLGLLSSNASITISTTSACYSTVSTTAYNEFLSYFTNATTAKVTPTAPTDKLYWLSSEYNYESENGDACTISCCTSNVNIIVAAGKINNYLSYRSILAF